MESEFKEITADKIKKMKVVFNCSYTNDYINATMTINEELQKALKLACVLDKEIVYLIDGNTRYRYAIKSWIKNSFYYSNYDFLFDKELIDNGKITLIFNSASNLNGIVLRCRESLESYLKTISALSEEVTITCQTA